MEKRIFARTDSSDFVGRRAELDRLLTHAKDESNGLAMLATPSAGASELLRQAYDRLFTEQEDVIPFYFGIKQNERTAGNAALRFLQEFLIQTVAFRRRDANVIDASPDICEIAELAVPADGYWIDRLVETCQSDSKLNDDRSFIRNCLSAPLRAAAHGARSFVMIDDLHLASQLDGGGAFLADFAEIFARASIPFVFAGHRRFLYGRTPFEMMRVEALSFTAAGALVERLSAKTGVAINEQTRDLIAVQLGGSPKYLTSFITSAADKSDDLKSFGKVEQTYTDAIFGGRIGKQLDADFDGILPDAGIQARVLRLLSWLLTKSGSKSSASYWKKHTGLAGAGFDSVIDALNWREIINAGAGSISIDAENIVLSDYIRGRVTLGIDGARRASAVGDSLSENAQRAPQLMARFYRRSSAIGLRELMRHFDGRQISPALIDYAKFRDQFKGARDDRILKALSEDNEKINLPRIVFTAHTAAFYPKLNEICDAERSAVALGFTNTAEKDETVWIAVEIDSKLEAKRELIDFWCDRLEMVALNCNFQQFKLWLVAPEGFAPEAMDVLRERNAYGSSRKQADLLAGFLGAEASAEKAENEYEIVVPMGGDTEMIAAHAIEEIAKRHGFPPKAINQIKTALVEACINAAEHSLSPDRKIYQKFTVDAKKITIAVSNRGLRLTDRAAQKITPDEGRRGWGLKLIKGLMDEVRIEQTDDGTRITMVKYLAPT